MSLQWNHNNVHDENCIDVLNKYGQLAGHVEADKAKIFCWILEEQSLDIAATVTGIDDRWGGVDITVTVTGTATTTMELQQTIQFLVI